MGKLSLLAMMILAVGFSLCGCAARHGQARVSAAVLVGRGCILSVALTDRTECTGRDLEHLHCTALSLTVKSGCEKLRVVQ